MKRKDLFRKATVISWALMFSMVFIGVSCSKENKVAPAADQNATTQDQKIQVIKDLVQKIPELKITNSKDKSVLSFRAKKGFSFSQPSNGYNFSSNQGVTYVKNSQGSTIIVSSSAFGSNAGGGTVVAGESSFNIAYTFCFSASDKAFNFFGPDIDGVSYVIGIDGDFEALQKGDVDEDNIFDYFRGYVVYIVYDDMASGKYDILNWFDNINDEPDDLKNKGFAYAIDFKNERFYLSSSGTLEVTGGQIGFSGKYLELSDFNLFGDEDNPSYKEVEGFGTMGCN